MTESEGQGISTSALTVVCSDCPRNGKTLFSKLAADLGRLRHGAAPQIFDTDEPDGALVAHFQNSSKVIDLTKTQAQVGLFDGMLSHPGGNFLVDLSAHHIARFFKIYSDIGFEEGAKETGLDVTVYFIIDRTVSSVEAVHQLASSLPETRFIPIRNAAIGDALAEGNAADLYQAVSRNGELLLPALSPEALGMVEHVDFHFDQFVAGRYDHFPFELKSELWGFMETLYEQRLSGDDASTTPV